LQQREERGNGRKEVNEVKEVRGNTQDKFVSDHSLDLSSGSLAMPKAPSCFYENKFKHLLTSFLNCSPKIKKIIC